MIALWVATAFGLECREVVNMDQAGVPKGEIVKTMNEAGTPVDRELIACLTAWEVDEDVIEAAWRLEWSRPSRDVPLVMDEAVEVPTWIEVDVMCGSVVVQGTEARRTRIDGRGDEGAKLRLSRSGGGLRVSVDRGVGLGSDPAERPKFGSESLKPAPTGRPCADLVVEVPRQTRVVATSTRADLRVEMVDGPIELTSHFGNVQVVGDTQELVLETTSGAILADTGARHADVKTVSGRVELGVGAEARVTGTSISGPIWVWGGPVQRLHVNSVSGDIRVNAAMMDSANAVLQTHKGRIEARVPGGEITASSHEGRVVGPSKMVRPDGPTQRVNRGGSALRERFSDVETLGPATTGLWKPEPERWWFGAGAVLRRTVDAADSGFTLAATSFSGDVRIRSAERFPAATGPVIAQIEAVRERLDACAALQMKRQPEGVGHAVLTLSLEDDGSIRRVTAPSTAEVPPHVEDGRFSACVVRAVEKLTFPAGGSAEVRWPVSFHPPVELPELVRPGPLSPVVERRKARLR